MTRKPRRQRPLALPLALALGACSMAPAYHVPTTPPGPGHFKAAPGWVVAQPADEAAKGEWWRLFNDPTLDSLEAKVAVTNQNVAFYRAAYAQARALVSETRASLFPVVSASGSANRSGSFASGSPATSKFSAQVGGTWDVDLWGKIGDTVRQAKASAQASAGDLANATLAAQGELATDYLQLRGIDAQIVLLDQTIDGYQRSLAVTQNKFAAGTVSHADVFSAQTTLDNARSQRRDLDRQRASLENAVAVLVGENPSAFTLAPAPWHPTVPEVPGVLPSQITQRRPDVAAAERRVAGANAAIGSARAAFFPALSLSGSAGGTSSSLSSLFGAAASFWSFGGSVVETLLDFGARAAKVREARAAFDQAVATYRQTVLGAFQQVETDLSASAAYHDEAISLASAADAATHAETITRNEYKAGTVDYTTVSTAQAAAHTARINQIQIVVSQQGTAVALIQAIGGAWTEGAPGQAAPAPAP